MSRNETFLTVEVLAQHALMIVAVSDGCRDWSFKNGR
jgi:hypothetical protein